MAAGLGLPAAAASSHTPPKEVCGCLPCAPPCHLLPTCSPCSKCDALATHLTPGGLQSPLSFGGFGAITRHIGRLTSAVESALDVDALSKEQLATINPYQANLRAAWLFQVASCLAGLGCLGVSGA